MSHPEAPYPQFPIVPALVVSSVLGGLVSLGLFGIWRVLIPVASESATSLTSSSTAEMPRGTVLEAAEFLPPLTADEQRIEAALEKTAQCDFMDTPLMDVVKFFAEQAQLKILIDAESLNEEGIAVDSPVTLKIDGLKLRSILELALRPLQLRAVPREGVLMVTPLSKRDEITRTYPVSDICKEPGESILDFQSLILLLEQETTGPWKDLDGDGGSITPNHATGSIVVRQTEPVHREVLQLLRNLRVAQRSNILLADKASRAKWEEQRAAAAKSLPKRPEAPTEFLEVIGTVQSEAEQRIEAALDKSITIPFQQTPLTDVVAFFAKELAINVWIDEKALAEEGIPLDTPVTLQLRQVSVRAALELILKPLELSAIVADDVLQVTTLKRTIERLITRTYPVSDLLGSESSEFNLVMLIQNETSGPWKDIDGEGGTIDRSAVTGSLVIRQTARVHREVLSLLRQQRAALPQSVRSRPVERPERRIEQRSMIPPSGGGVF